MTERAYIHEVYIKGNRRIFYHSSQSYQTCWFIRGSEVRQKTFISIAPKLCMLGQKHFDSVKTTKFYLTLVSSMNERIQHQ